MLSSYEYKIMFRRTEAHVNADALSHLPLLVVPAESQAPPELILLTEHLEQLPVTAQNIKLWTRRDPNLSVVLRQVMEGLSSPGDLSHSVFYQKQEELSVH